MIAVRPYLPEDREAVEKICLENAGCANSLEETKEYTLISRCSYYIEQEPDNCYVAADDDGSVIGYVLCCDNYNNYERSFSEKYIPQAASISAKRYVDIKLDMLKHAMYRRYYPAHIYIDVTLSRQNLGIGSLLLSTLKAHLRKNNVKGMMAVCEAGNEDQIRFFKKNGFEEIIETKFGKTMVLDFDK